MKKTIKIILFTLCGLEIYGWVGTSHFVDIDLARMSSYRMSDWKYFLTKFFIRLRYIPHSYLGVTVKA